MRQSVTTIPAMIGGDAFECVQKASGPLLPAMNRMQVARRKSICYQQMKSNLGDVLPRPDKHGYFGVVSPSTGSKTRNIVSHDNLGTAKDFYDRIANGGKEDVYNHGALRITRMHDGSVVTMRTISHSDGTPVVEININHSNSTGGVKKQKIHFILGDEKK